MITRSVRSTKAFTLIELLVVISIILITTVVVGFSVLPALNQRKSGEAARILQAAVVGARDAAIRANAPRGIRLLPDETLVIPSFSSGSPPGTTQLAYNRIVQIEPADDYTSGKVTIGPMLGSGVTPPGVFPPLYPNQYNGVYPYPDANDGTQRVLMVEESPYVGGYLVGTTAIPNEPTSWYWNVRIGDKIKIGGTGQTYTIVGPCTVSPLNPLTPGQNPELFVNIGPPGSTLPMTRTYYDTLASMTVIGHHNPEFLFLVNGVDDNKNGYTDEGFDGFDNDYQYGVDQIQSGTNPQISEWVEVEAWQGSLSSVSLVDPGAGANSPSPVWTTAHAQTQVHDLSYVIKRRPVPVEGAREVTLPGGIVVDATTWNSTQERSRLPIDPNSLYVDFMVNADGQVVPQTIYSTPIAFNEPFFHFWLTDRTDVFEPIDNRANTVPYLLPMPADAQNYPNNKDTSKRVLKGERRLVTVFTKSGLVTSNTLENFDGNIPFTPFWEAQQGMQAAK